MMGFPSPALDYAQRRLDLESLVVAHPAATFFVRAESNAMARAGIRQGDILVVDRSLTATHGRVVLATIHGEFHLRLLQCEGGRRSLVTADGRGRAIAVDGTDCMVWGVVTFSIRRHSDETA